MIKVLLTTFFDFINTITKRIALLMTLFVFLMSLIRVVNRLVSRSSFLTTTLACTVRFLKPNTIDALRHFSFTYKRVVLQLRFHSLYNHEYNLSYTLLPEIRPPYNMSY